MTFLQATDPAVLDWSRAQFALTACYHWLFVPLTLGLALVMAIMETIYYRTGDEFWKTNYQVLAEALRYQLRYRCCHGYYPRI